MGRLTVYIDDATRARIEAAARHSESSVSQWVKEKLEEALERDWPKSWFDLLGALANTDLRRPPQPRLTDDIKRERL